MGWRSDPRLVGVAAWIIACSALAGLRQSALGQPGESRPTDGVRVEGMVTYRGPLPEPIPLPEAGTVRHLIEVEPKTKGLKDAVVWLEGVFPPAKPAQPVKSTVIQVDQRDFQFVPHVLAINAGQEVEFLNSDAANHGVSAASFEAENRFNVVVPSGGSCKHRFVASNRPVAIGCPIHWAMSAWIFVFGHPYHAVTDDHGSFHLPPVAPGQYTLRLRHPDSGIERRQDFVVSPGMPVRRRIEFVESDLKLGATATPSQ
jgi:plastocyanin